MVTGRGSRAIEPMETLRGYTTTHHCRYSDRLKCAQRRPSSLGTSERKLEKHKIKTNSDLNFVSYVYFTLYRFLHKCLNKPCHVLVELSNRVTLWNIPFNLICFETLIRSLVRVLRVTCRSLKIKAQQLMCFVNRRNIYGACWHMIR